MSEIPARCASFEADLSAWIDGELDAGRSAELRAHLAACAACAGRVEALRAVDATLREVARASGPAETARIERMRAATAARLRGDASGRLSRRSAPRRRRMVTTLAAAGAAAGIAAIVLFVERTEPTRETTAIARPAPPSPSAAASHAIAEAEQRAAERPASDAFASKGASTPPETPTATPSDEELELASALVAEERGAPGPGDLATPIRERIAALAPADREAVLAAVPRLRAMAPEERAALLERARRAREHPAE